jgi:hypothetical protein
MTKRHPSRREPGTGHSRRKPLTIVVDKSRGRGVRPSPGPQADSSRPGQLSGPVEVEPFAVARFRRVSMVAVGIYERRRQRRAQAARTADRRATCDEGLRRQSSSTASSI